MLRLNFDRWAKSASFHPSEIVILEKLLPQVTPVATKLLRQAQHPPYVVRKTVETAGYEARIPYLQDDAFLVEADRDVESPSVETTDSRTGRRLRFSTAVLRGGFLFGLRGIALDGRPWPRKWHVGSDIAQPDEVLVWLDALPPLMDEANTLPVLKQLVDWSGAEWARISEEQVRCLRVAPPASETEITACEDRLQASLPDEYRQLVTITNGFAIQRGRPYELLGTKDILRLYDRWLGITPLYEDGYVAFPEGDVTATCYLLSPDGRANRIGNLRNYVRESIEWEVVDR